ncbi:MAG: hypothetical protein WCH34_09900 [Bacteroidota bacterium]
MQQQKKYTIVLWEQWNKTISDAIDDFYETFLNYPTIMEANSHTYSQFDFLINIIPDELGRVEHRDELTNQVLPISEDEYVEISSFSNKHCSLDFAVFEEHEDREFLLIYDDEPDWDNDGNNIIIVDPIDEIEKVDEKIFVTLTQK